MLGKVAESQFKSEIKQYEEELRLSINAEEIEALGNRTNVINVSKKDTSTGNVNENYESDMKKYIPSFNNSKYGTKLEIRNDELVYIDETNNQERKWFGEVELSLAKIFITINYADKEGNKLAEPETISTTTGRYEIEPKVIEHYEAERPLYEGKTTQDKDITLTYLPESGNLSYIGLDSNGNETEDESQIVAYTVSGIGSFTGEDLVIPREYNEKPVTQIKSRAFFRNINLKKSIIPNNIKKLGDACFEACSNLETLSLSAIKLEGSDHFENTKLTNVIIGRDVEELGFRPFYGCTKLEDVLICTEKANINASIFTRCNNLEAVKTNACNVKYIVQEGVLYSKNGKEIYMYPPAKKGDFVISENVEKLNNVAFYGNIYLNNISIPSTVKVIGDACFEACSNLETLSLSAIKLEGSDHFENTKLIKVIIGKEVEQLGNRPFYGCTKLEDVLICTEKANINASIFTGCKNLEAVKVNADNIKYMVQEGVLYSKNGKEIYMYPPAKKGDFVISDNVEQLKVYSFYGNTYLNNINIPNNVKVIESACFEACSNLEILNLNAINLVGWDTFRNTKLTNVIIGKNVQQLGTRPFYQCSTITEINYLGTMEEWNNINKSSINSGSNLNKIVCSDGAINI